MVDHHRVNELLKLINCHTESLEEQTHHFGMMDALMQVALDGEFLDNPKVILHHYLCTMSELVDKASGINEASLALLREFVKKNEDVLFNEHDQ
jgi:hypothetical protein